MDHQWCVVASCVSVCECECICTPWLTPSVSPSHVWHQVTVRGLNSVSRLTVCVLYVFPPCHAMSGTKCATIPCLAPSDCPWVVQCVAAHCARTVRAPAMPCHVWHQVCYHSMSGTKCVCVTIPCLAPSVLPFRVWHQVCYHSVSGTK